jgi:hypothetical protein
MKKLFFFILAAFTVAGSAHAQSDNKAVLQSPQVQGDYKAILKQTFDAFDTTYADFQAKADLGNKLILIAKKFPNEWVTNYYAAYSRVQLSHLDPNADKKDPYIDEAETYLNEAITLLGKKTDEMHVLLAMVASARLSVKPQSRWMKYGKIFDEEMEEAKKLNADNPRIYLQKGISKFYMPKPFGGGAKNAAPYFEKAEPLFAKESTDDITKPYWGRSANKYFMAQVKKGED